MIPARRRTSLLGDTASSSSKVLKSAHILTWSLRGRFGVCGEFSPIQSSVEDFVGVGTTVVPPAKPHAAKRDRHTPGAPYQGSDMRSYHVSFRNIFVGIDFFFCIFYAVITVLFAAIGMICRP